MRKHLVVMVGLCVAHTALAQPSPASGPRPSTPPDITQMPPPEPAPPPTVEKPKPPRPEGKWGCDRFKHVGLNDGPVTIGFADGDFRTGRRACPRSEVALTARLGLVLDTPNFYGNYNADALLAGSYSIKKRGEIFAALELVHYQFAQNAVLKSTGIGLGQLTVGGSILALERRSWALSPYVRLMLPTSSFPNVRTLGAEVGLAAQFRPYEKFGLHGYVGADVSGSVGPAPGLARGGALIALGLQYQPATWFGLVIDLHLSLGHQSALDYFAPAIALRFRMWRGLGLELAGIIPVVGADRHDALAALRLQYRF